MTVTRYAGAFAAALLFSSSAGMAASDSECTVLWQKSDANSDDVLTKDEGLESFVTAMQGKSLGTPARLTREEFVTHCKAGVFATTVAAPLGTQTLDVIEDTAKQVTTLMPGANSYTEDQARRRIEGFGYSDVGRLAKDANGIWRGTAAKAGVKKNIGLDYQGNVAAD